MGPLHDALAESQRLGQLGARPIADVIDHSRLFVAALDGIVGRVVDLGAGGGVPGLVIASDRPDLEVVLVDRRRKRTDLLERLVRRLELTDRVSVVAADVDDLVRTRDVFDAAVARGLGPPLETLERARALTRIGGRIVISEPPDGNRWDENELDRLRVVREPSDRRIATFRSV